MTDHLVRNRAVRFLAPRRQAPVRLICLPYAGAGLSAYGRWAAGVEGLDLLGVQLPGREDRFPEKPYTRMEPLVDWLCQALPAYLDRPFGLFGHSMGGRVAYALAHALIERGLRSPLALFVSGTPGPCLRTPVGGWDRSDEELLSWLREMDGTPGDILDQRELIAVLLPTLRADLTVVATFGYRERAPLPIPIHAFAGRDDRYASPARMEHWRCETAGEFRLTTYPGGHFFIADAMLDVFGSIATDLHRLANHGGAA